MSERQSIKFEDADHSHDDELEAVRDAKGVTITIEEPWAGDSETGFGRSCSIRLSHADAIAFAKWLANGA